MAMVGLAMLQSEWTMEQAQKIWTPMTRAVEHVGVPGYQFQTAVLWDGSLVFGPLDFRDLKVMQAETVGLGNNRLHLSVGFGDPMRFADRSGDLQILATRSGDRSHQTEPAELATRSGDRSHLIGSQPLVRRWLEDGRLPIPHVETHDGDLVWHEVVYARFDHQLITHASWMVTNTGTKRDTGHLWLHFGDTSKVALGYKCHVEPELAPALPIQYKAPYLMMDGNIRGMVPKPKKGQLIWHDDGRLEWVVSLASKEKADFRIALPYGLTDKFDDKPAFDEVKRYWKKVIDGPGQIKTPDPFINDYLAAVAGQMAEQVAYREKSDLWMYKTSPNQYEGYWPCNAAKALPTFDLRGQTALNERVLSGFLKMQTSDVGGLNRTNMGHGELLGEGYAKVDGFLGNFGEWTANTLLISHGLGMWALASHYRITRDEEWLKIALPAMIKAFDWVATQRKRTMEKDVPYRGLLPAASAHDWLAGNTIFNDAWCIYGMTELVRLLREIKHPRAEEMAREIADYRKALHDRYAEATGRAKTVPMPDGSQLPFVPRMVQELDWRTLDWTYTGYGPLRAGALGALDPNDKLVDPSLAFLDAGMPRGEGAYYGGLHKGTADMNFADISVTDAPRHWLWRHYVEYETMWPMGGPLFLARDDLPRFFEWLFNNLAVVLHRDWRVGVESLDGVPSCAPGDGERWQIIRRMFVNERGGYDGSAQSLWLLQAIPRSWLFPGAHLSVSKMATWFGGSISLSLIAARDSVTVTIDLPHFASPPAEIVMRLRSPDARPLRSATLDGKPLPLGPTDTVRLPTTLSGRHVVVGRF